MGRGPLLGPVKRDDSKRDDPENNTPVARRPVPNVAVHQRRHVNRVKRRQTTTQNGAPSSGRDAAHVPRLEPAPQETGTHIFHSSFGGHVDAEPRSGLLAGLARWARLGLWLHLWPLGWIRTLFSGRARRLGWSVRRCRMSRKTPHLRLSGRGPAHSTPIGPALIILWNRFPRLALTLGPRLKTFKKTSLENCDFFHQ